MTTTDFDRIAGLLLSHPFRAAKSMPAIPHAYTLRKEWGSGQEFEEVVQYIRTHGYEGRFGRTIYRYFDVGEHQYWTMGAPVRETILINRAVKKKAKEPYDDIADKYDAMWQGDLMAEVENRQVMEHIGDVGGKSVLDVGCGTGFFLDEYRGAPFESYVGIDPSVEMLSRLRAKQLEHYAHLPISTGNCALKAYFTEQLFDVVLALFGVGSYLTGAELARIPGLLAPGGVAHVMFIRDGYTPLTHTKTGVHPPFRPWRREDFRPTTTVIPVGEGHWLTTIRREE